MYPQDIIYAFPKRQYNDKECMALLEKSKLSDDDLEELALFALEVEIHQLFIQISEKLLNEAYWSDLMPQLIKRSCRYFLDKKYARSMCRTIIKDIALKEEGKYYFYDIYMSIAKLAVEVLGDIRWGRCLCMSLQDKINYKDRHKLLTLAELVYQLFGNKKWSEALLDRSMGDCMEYVEAGSQYILIHNNSSNARLFFQLALSLAKDSADKSYIACAVINDLKDNAWGESILKEAVSEIKDANSLIMTVRAIIDALGYREWGMNLLNDLNKYQLDEYDEIMLNQLKYDYELE